MRRRFAVAVIAAACSVAPGSIGAARAEDRAALCASNRSFVSFLHRRLLGRESSAPELEGTIDALRAGLPRQEVIRQVFRSAEYQRLSKPAMEFVSDVLAASLEREPEPGELGPWLELSARVSREGLVDGVLATPGFAERVRACRSRS